MTLLTTRPALETWIPVSWEEFVQIADHPDSAKLKSYYHNGCMRIEPMSTGSDHSNDHAIIIFALTLFATLKQIPIMAKDGCSYRQIGGEEFQPDASCYVGENVDAIPWGTRVVDLDLYPFPDVVIEISDTSIADDKGEKRIQYETLRIPEYWIVDVKNLQILAWSVSAHGSSQRIEESQILPGLRFEILTEVLRRSRQENQSIVGAWLMSQWT